MFRNKKIKNPLVVSWFFFGTLMGIIVNLLQVRPVTLYYIWQK